MRLLQYITIAGAAALMCACSPDTYDLVTENINPGDLVEGIAYTVTADEDNPNIIHLRSLMPTSYSVQWQHPQGYSQDRELDLKIAFDGTYEVTFGVQTRGGMVYGDPYEFTIDQMCTDFVTGEMWEWLTGGVGQSKTWIPDDGTYGLAHGYYSCLDPSVTYLNMTRDEGKYDWYATPTSLSWWLPANGDVGITDDDLAGSMTFALDGKASLSVTTVTGGIATTKEGLFDMNTDAHTISATNVEFLHAAWTNGKCVDFSKGYQILVLTENQLMIANYRDEALSGESACLYCFNFVSKDYADNYVPTEEIDTTVDLPDGWNTLIATQNSYCSWKLDSDVPFDWTDLGGNRKHSYASQNDYPAAYRTYSSVLDGFSLKFATPSVEGYEATLPNGDTVIGTYTISTSDQSIYLTNGIGSTDLAKTEVTLSANSDGSLRVLGLETDNLGRISDLWLGKDVTDISGQTTMYLAYHFVPDYGTTEAKSYKAQLHYFNMDWTFFDSDDLYFKNEGSYTIYLYGSDSNCQGVYFDIYELLGDYPNCDVAITDIKVDGTSIAFDDSIIDRCTGDDASTARRYIVNPWSGDSGSAQYQSLMNFSSSIAITFKVTFDTGSAFVN
ncbi:MAG: hypothetical protein LUC85_08740 [Bacteroidales bacterium]|nr:hypothetical protein [Bacteroidales bacterium]MCD8394900.1 hypothetical protein [Bacteroidales bacterium]